MDLKKWLLGAAGALALGSIATSVEAAPAIDPGTSYKAAASEGLAVANVHWRWRHYYRYRPYYFAPSYHYYRPYRHRWHGGYYGYRFYRHHHWGHRRWW